MDGRHDAAEPHADALRSTAPCSPRTRRRSPAPTPPAPRDVGERDREGLRGRHRNRVADPDASAAVLAAGAFAATPAALADGTYTVQATQGDLAGNTGTSAAVTFRIDTTAPTVDDHRAGQRQLVDRDDADVRRHGRRRRRATRRSVTVKVYSGPAASGSPVQTLTATRSGAAWSVPASAALAVGTYTAQARSPTASGTRARARRRRSRSSLRRRPTTPRRAPTERRPCRTRLRLRSR